MMSILILPGYVNGTATDSVTTSTNSRPSKKPATEPGDQTCVTSLTKVNNVNPCRKTVIFEDNFNSIDDSKWSKLRQFSGEPVTQNISVEMEFRTEYFIF